LWFYRSNYNQSQYSSRSQFYWSNQNLNHTMNNMSVGKPKKLFILKKFFCNINFIFYIFKVLIITLLWDYNMIVNSTDKNTIVNKVLLITDRHKTCRYVNNYVLSCNYCIVSLVCVISLYFLKHFKL